MKPKTVIIKNQSASSENIFFKGQHIKCRKNQLSCLNFPLLANTIIARGGKKQKERKRSYGKQEV